MSEKTGRERFLDNYFEISRFCKTKRLPRRRNTILAIADFIHNHKRDRVISHLAKRKEDVKRFFRISLARSSEREELFAKNSEIIRLITRHLLNEKLSNDPLRDKDAKFYEDLEEEEEEEEEEDGKIIRRGAH